jgi:hypothetical protein
LVALAGRGILCSFLIPSRWIDAPVQIPARSGLTTTATGGKVPRDLVRLLPLTFTVTILRFFEGQLAAIPASAFTLSASVNDAFPVFFYAKESSQSCPIVTERHFRLDDLLEKGALRFKPCSDSMIRVLYSPAHEFPRVANYLVIKSNCPSSPFDVTESAAEITLTYDGRRVEIKRNLGERLASSAGSGAPVQYALQSQAMRSNLSPHNSGGPVE